MLIWLINFDCKLHNRIPLIGVTTITLVLRVPVPHKRHWYINFTHSDMDKSQTSISIYYNRFHVYTYMKSYFVSYRDAVLIKFVITAAKSALGPTGHNLHKKTKRWSNGWIFYRSVAKAGQDGGLMEPHRPCMQGPPSAFNSSLDQDWSRFFDIYFFFL